MNDNFVKMKMTVFSYAENIQRCLLIKKKKKQRNFRSYITYLMKYLFVSLVESMT